MFASSIDWGTFPDWASVGAFLLAIVLVVREARDRSQGQALAVTFDFDWPFSYDPAIASVTNSSNLPIKNVRVLAWRTDPGFEVASLAHGSPTLPPTRPRDEFTVRQSRGTLGDVAPGVTARAEIMTQPPHDVGWAYAAVFLDAKDTTWRIWHDGMLERVRWPLSATKRRTRGPRKHGPLTPAQPRRL